MTLQHKLNLKLYKVGVKAQFKLPSLKKLQNQHKDCLSVETIHLLLNYIILKGLICIIIFVRDDIVLQIMGIKKGINSIDYGNVTNKLAFGVGDGSFYVLEFV